MSSSSRSSSVNRWSEYQRTKGSQTDGLTNNERLPILNRSSSSSGGHLSINSMDSLEGSLSVMKFDDQNSNSASSLAFNFVKYHCKDCIASCKIHRGVSCKNMFYDRFPKGCAVMVVLLINMLESFAIYGAFRGLQERIMGISTTGRPIFGYIFVFFQWCAGRMFYPITGLIADTCLGRYRTIRIGFWLMWIAFVLISIGEVLEYANIGSKAAESYVLPIVAVVLLIISSASVEANIIPFGVDQIQQGAPSSEISSYFYCYYFSARAGSLLSVCVFLALVGTHKSLVPDSNLDPVNGCGFTCQTFLAVHPLFAVFSVTLALILHVLAQNKYFRDRDYSNPLRLIINVLYYAATVKRRVSRYRRAFRYGEERKPRIELAKEEFDGIFTSEEVEDVKTFFQISLVTFSLSGNCFTYGMVSNYRSRQSPKS